MFPLSETSAINAKHAASQPPGREKNELSEDGNQHATQPQSNSTNNVQLKTHHSEASINQTVDITQLIKSNYLFSHATDAFIQDLEKRMKYRYIMPGDTIIKGGDIGKAMFFIIRGFVAVSSKDGDSIFADLGPGQFFGGMLFYIYI